MMTIKEEKALNQWLDKQLKTRLIVKSKSRYTVPYFYILKKDRLLQLVQDHRKLNQVTIKDKTPLPLIREIINKLDLIWEYNNIQIKEGDKWKAAFFNKQDVTINTSQMYYRLG